MKQELEQNIARICKELFSAEVNIELTRPDEKFGDFATSIALQLSKQLDKNPNEIANQIVNKLRSTSELIKDINIAGPGFINITLTDNALLKTVNTGKRSLGEIKVVIETNNPNPFKAMHIGHAFNAIIADTIANLLEFGGAETIRVSYHGDVGAHVGKSMYSLLKFIDGDIYKLSDIDEKDRNSFMSKMYSQGSSSYKEDASATEEIDKLSQESFTLEDPLYRNVYEICKDWSFDQIDLVVGRLGNKPIVKRYLESEADKLGVEIVRSNVGKVFFESDGALVFPGSKYGIFDNAFVSSTGRGLYAARDLGLIKLKQNDFSPNKSYIVTAEEQKDYFRGVLKAAELAMPELSDVTVNISTGTVKLSTGKMSSRDGEILEISWLFDQIESALSKRDGAVNNNIITGALRYQFLKSRTGSDVIFDIDESISTHGNSGPYLQYSHARARSILSKALTSNFKLQNSSFEENERSLLRKISEYSEVVDNAVTELMPHLICTYLYELAQVFNSFYEHNRVIDDPRQNQRLYLVKLYAETLKNGLAILGIDAPDKM